MRSPRASLSLCVPAWLPRALLVGGLATGLAGCGPKYSPNVYSTSAVQQANKVERGVVVGVRRIDVTAAGLAGGATGAAAGGIAGSQTPGGSVGSAFGALGGALLGGLVGAGVEHAAGDTSAYEYIVQEPSEKPGGQTPLVSVTQKDRTPLEVGAKVLVIYGSQARVVPDYTETTAAAATPPSAQPMPAETAPPPPAVSATPLAPLPPLPAFTPAP